MQEETMVPDFVSTTAIIGVMIPIFFMLAGTVIAVFAINRSFRNKQLKHEMMMKAMEKGYEIPDFPEQKSYKSRTAYPFTWPFIFIGLGLAMVIMYWSGEGDSESLGFGLAFLFVGIGLFASKYYGVKNTPGATITTPVSPVSTPPKVVVPEVEKVETVSPYAPKADDTTTEK
jgi:Domain of unknown function (DUF6249)